MVFIDKSGKTVIKLDYDYTESFSDGLAVVSVNKKLLVLLIIKVIL